MEGPPFKSDLLQRLESGFTFPLEGWSGPFPVRSRPYPVGGGGWQQRRFHFAQQTGLVGSGFLDSCAVSGLHKEECGHESVMSAVGMGVGGAATRHTLVIPVLERRTCIACGHMPNIKGVWMLLYERHFALLRTLMESERRSGAKGWGNLNWSE